MAHTASVYVRLFQPDKKPYGGKGFHRTPNSPDLNFTAQKIKN
jgi:hypothetical protein